MPWWGREDYLRIRYGQPLCHPICGHQPSKVYRRWHEPSSCNRLLLMFSTRVLIFGGGSLPFRPKMIICSFTNSSLRYTKHCLPPNLGTYLSAEPCVNITHCCCVFGDPARALQHSNTIFGGEVKGSGRPYARPRAAKTYYCISRKIRRCWNLWTLTADMLFVCWTTDYELFIPDLAT